MNEVFGNSILYKMCEEYIRHDDAEIVSGKLWLISRSYVVSPQRRKSKNTQKNNEYEFFFDEIAKVFVKNPKREDLDKKIQLLSRKIYTGDFENDKGLLFDTVKLVDLFNILMKEVMVEYDNIEEEELHNITINNHISLASKYLHFHLKNIVFIYDTHTVKNARKRLNIKDLYKTGLMFSEFDYNQLDPNVNKNYKPHVLRCYSLMRELPENERTPRDLDWNLLTSGMVM